MVYLKLKGNRMLDNLEAIEFLQCGGLLRESVMCERCEINKSMIQDVSHQDGYIWRCKSCRRKTFVRTGTALIKSRLSLSEILNLMFKFSEECLVRETSSALTLDKNTASKWFNIFRSSLKKSLELSFAKSGGDELNVQIDETVIAKRKCHRGRKVPQQWLFGAIYAVNGHYILKCISGRSKAELKTVIIDCITVKSVVHSDM
ncbi:hypothetical protein ENBRE01_1753 [Enteropsectra breve]|nr:hypothetical protein ENBRE01_1753 [Enteropsectra breve]